MLAQVPVGTQGSSCLPDTTSSLDPLKLYIVFTGDVGEFYLFLSCVAVFTQGKLQSPKKIYSEHSSQRAKRVANNVSSYGRDMVQNGLGFMHSLSLKSHGPVLLSMKLLPYPVKQSCFPSALDKLNETALRRMVPAATSLAN